MADESPKHSGIPGRKIKRVPIALPNPWLADVSPDGSTLLLPQARVDPNGASGVFRFRDFISRGGMEFGWRWTRKTCRCCFATWEGLTFTLSRWRRSKCRPRTQGRNETGVWFRRHDGPDKC
jgi:hypothetical protein